MSSLIMTAILFALKPQAPVSVPVGKTLLITWSNSPTGPGSAAMRDGQDSGDDAVYIHRDDLHWAGAYFVFANGFSGPQLILNGPDGVLVTTGGTLRGVSNAGWVLTSSTAAPFSATFNATALPALGGWGGDYTITITEAP
jgi:hypothetical protein